MAQAALPVAAKAQQIEWIQQFGTAGDEETAAIAVDASGVYVAGVTTGALPGQTSAGSGDAFVRRYDANGNELWTRQFGSAAFDKVLGGALDTSGVYVAGVTFGALPGQTFTGFQGDAFLRKYDANGNELWTRQFGTLGDDWAFAVAADAFGVYVAGYVSGALPGQTSAGSSDAFVRKYDANGNELWTRQFGSAAFDESTAVALDSFAVYVAGLVSSALPGQTSAGDADAFVRKYDANGNELWTRQFGSAASDGASGIAVDASSVYVGGSTNGALPGQASAGGLDAFVRKYDTSGNELWTAQFGATSFDGASEIAVDASSVYVAGFLSDDAFVRKYDANGNELWTHQFGSAAFDSASGIAVDASGVYVGGSTNGALPGQASAGGLDAFVVKLAPFAGAPATLTLSPATSTNPVDTQHCVTATVMNAFGNPTPDVTVRFTVIGAASGAATTDANGEAVFCYAGPTSPGADAIDAFADTDNDATQDLDEPTGTATKTWTPAAPATLTLAPATATNPVGTNHTVTAAVRDAFNNLTPGITVRFAVTGSVTTSGSCTTNGTGQCSFTYSGSTPGADAIHAYADTDNDTTQDADEPAGVAAKTWTAIAGARIAFASTRDRNSEIYVMNADGTGQTRLTNNPAVDMAPTWSPDGTKIAFVTNRHGSLNFEIYTMNANGTGQMRLTNNPAVDTAPAWSPDGAKIAFSTNRHASLNFEIYTMNATNGTGLMRLTTSPAVDGEPAWSPDGSRIAFATNRDGTWNFEIYTMNAANGTGLMRLTINPAIDGEPDWSPDGAKIAFTTNRDGSSNFEIYVMNANGSSPTRLTTHPKLDISPAWYESATHRRLGAAIGTGRGALRLRFVMMGLETHFPVTATLFTTVRTAGLNSLASKLSPSL